MITKKNQTQITKKNTDKCLPTRHGSVVVKIDQWGPAIFYRLVSTDDKRRAIQLKLNEELDWNPSANKNTEAFIGWTDHDMWHRCKAIVTNNYAHPRTLELKILSLAVLQDRRMHVRANINKPADIKTVRHSVKGSIVDVSEASARIRVTKHTALHKKDMVAITFRCINPNSQRLQTISIGGEITIIREHPHAPVNYKDLVVSFGKLTPSDEDNMRALVYAFDLASKKEARKLAELKK